MVVPTQRSSWTRTLTAPATPLQTAPRTPPPPGCASTPRCGSSAATAPAKSTCTDGRGPWLPRAPERYQQIHERIEHGDSLRAIARELNISRGTILRFARATNTEQLGAVPPIMCGAG
ncbi:helix-turn-helix domain-containing protein [Streptomyces mirabilis]|uniref:helix-turn-helix domain-containing protein n=1 Tax=Streptomyces mirabilis TaxID=68239 RepID=UPI003692E2E0